MDNTVTDEWVRNARSGDRDAYTKLFSLYRPRLAVFINYRIPSEMASLIETEDVLQELFAKAFAELDQFEYRGPGSFFRWLATRANNLVKGKLRYSSRKKRKALRFLNTKTRYSENESEPFVDTQTPTRIYRTSERLQSLFELLDALPEKYRQAILLAKIEGLSIAESADRMSLSKSAFSIVLHRALKRIRELQPMTITR